MTGTEKRIRLVVVVVPVRFPDVFKLKYGTLSWNPPLASPVLVTSTPASNSITGMDSGVCAFWRAIRWALPSGLIVASDSARSCCAFSTPPDNATEGFRNESL